MTIEKRDQVFVSSTFMDLEEERRMVIQTLLEADCIPAGMEMFPASSSQKFELIKSVIDLCDYYVVIIGGRYGSVDNESNLSYTEMEYDYAVEKGIPVMAFLHGDSGRIALDKSEQDPEFRAKLEAFRRRTEERMVKYWTSPQDLAGQVSLAIMQIRKSHPSIGWIRADEAMTPETRTELAELRAKVGELTFELKELEREGQTQSIKPAFAHGDEETIVEMDVEFSFHEEDEHSLSEIEDTLLELNVSWNEILKHVGPNLLTEQTEHSLQESLDSFCFNLAHQQLIVEKVKVASVVDGKVVEPIKQIFDVKITKKCFDDIKVQLLALGYIEEGVKRRSPGDGFNYWMLTENGKTELIELRAARKGTKEESIVRAVVSGN